MKMEGIFAPSSHVYENDSDVYNNKRTHETSNDACKRRRFRMGDQTGLPNGFKTQWQEVQEWCGKLDGMEARLSMIYKEYNFPMEIRHYFAQWIEQQDWQTIELDSPQANTFGGVLLTQLLEKVSQYGKSDFMVKLKMQEIHTKLKETFSSTPGELISVLRSCLNRERLLIDSCAAKEDQTEQDILALKYTKDNEDIMRDMDKFKSPLHEMELDQSKLKNNTEEFTVLYRDINHDIMELEQKIKQCSQGNMMDDYIKLKDQKIQQRSNKATGIFRSREALHQKLQNFFHAQFKPVAERVWQQIAKYRKDQKLIITGLSSPPEGALDGLNKLADDLSKYLINLLLVIKQTLDQFQKLSYDRDTPKDQLLMLQTEVNTILKTHLDKIFLIDKQPWQVMKVSKGKSLNFQMSGRLLGGFSLGLTHNPPKVTVSLHSEKEGLAEALSKQIPPPGVCEIVNGKEVLMEYKRGIGHLVVTLSNTQLRGVKRMEKLNRDERVTEQKYGMIFYTKVTVLGVEYHLKTLSMPIILTSQSSQEWAAKGTLIWDAAFSDDVRHMFVDRDQVEWQEMAQVLNALFKSKTSQGLKPEQLHYLAQRTFHGTTGTVADYSKQPLTKDRFIKDTLPGTNFSIWKWVFACMNLIKEHLNKEWKEGLIEGFVSRDQADMMLQDKEPGTFLLRFREKHIESTQCSTICATLTPVAVIINDASGNHKISHMSAKLTASTLHETPLTKYLQSMEIRDPSQPNTVKQVFRYLHPDREFQEAFKNFLSGPDDSDRYYDPVEQKHLLRPVDFRPAFPPSRSESMVSSPGSIYNPSSPGNQSEFSYRSVTSPGPVVMSNLVLGANETVDMLDSSGMTVEEFDTVIQSLSLQQPPLHLPPDVSLQTNQLPDLMQNTVSYQSQMSAPGGVSIMQQGLMSNAPMPGSHNMVSGMMPMQGLRQQQPVIVQHNPMNGMNTASTMAIESTVMSHPNSVRSPPLMAHSSSASSLMGHHNGM